VVFEAIFVN